MRIKLAGPGPKQNFGRREGGIHVAVGGTKLTKQKKDESFKTIPITLTRVKGIPYIIYGYNKRLQETKDLVDLG